MSVITLKKLRLMNCLFLILNIIYHKQIEKNRKPLLVSQTKWLYPPCIFYIFCIPLEYIIYFARQVISHIIIQIYDN